MAETLQVLVTGATGKLGRAVCEALLARKMQVRATDLRYARGFPTPIELGDLKDEHFVHRLVDGCHAVVHLGNHPNAGVGLSPQRILAENTAMNANVFHAALDRGVGAIVFASSVQATVRRDHPAPGPPRIPYLPLDGELPASPGQNTYGQSKEFAERMLRLAVQADSGLSATALRFPMLVDDWLHRRFASRAKMPLDAIDFEECTAHLYMDDAGRLVADVVERRLPGYHQYFPALMMELRGYPIPELVSERYAAAKLRTPADELESLIDISAITRELGWVPTRRIVVQVDRGSSTVT
jgi:nucleoside-diphosphate-sugar epimerase